MVQAMAKESVVHTGVFIIGKPDGLNDSLFWTESRFDAHFGGIKSTEENCENFFVVEKNGTSNIVLDVDHFIYL